MGFSYGQSTSWAISGGASAGLVPVAGISAYAVTLFDVQNQIFFPALLAGSSVGAGLKAGGSVSTFSPTFFTVSTPMYASDFDNSLCTMVDVDFVPGVGGAATGMTIWGVSHSPAVLDLSGLSAGVSVGATISPLLYLCVFDSKAWQNTGCLITPGGDPLCGGSSQDPSQASDPNMTPVDGN
jgi:hypothetical protein